MSKQSRRPNRAAHHHRKPPLTSTRSRWSVGKLSWILGIAAVVAAVVGGSFLVGGNSSGSSEANLPVGSTAPSFSAQDVLTGNQISSQQLAGKNVLYFFSSGSSCQACLVQAQALQRDERKIADAHMQLVVVTNDDVSTLVSSAQGYHLHSPLIADPDGTLTNTFGAVGGGMDMGPNMADHSFILVDRAGEVRFHKDFPSMWVSTGDLLRQLPKVA